MTQHPEKEFLNFPCEVCHNQWCKCIAEEFTLSSPEKEPCEWEAKFDSLFNSCGFDHIESYGEIPNRDKIKLFISINMALVKKEAREESTALARREISREILPKVQKFIDKVESGKARSKETYADMLSIRNLLADLSDKIK